LTDTEPCATPEAEAFFASAISEKNLAFAKSSLASGAGELYVLQFAAL